MTRLDIRPFSDEFLPHAGELLAARHSAHRAVEPLLPAGYENAEAATAEVATLAQSEGASGAVALRASRVVGFLLGVRKSDEIWGANVWVETAGHAVEAAEDLRDLYGAAAAGWLEEGRDRHYGVVPATDRDLVQAWSRVSFGQQHAYGIREVPEVDWPDGVRLADERDLDALVELAPLLPDHQSQAPVFGGGPPQDSEEEVRADMLEDLAKPEIADLVAEREGRIVGAFQVVPVELSAVHTGLARPEGAAFLGWAATHPEARGTGAGVALTTGAFAWAREHGHEVIITDWRVTNLLASRFWPARGFRESFLRLYRRIP